MLGSQVSHEGGVVRNNNGHLPWSAPAPPALSQSFLLLATLNLWLHSGEIKILNKRMICFSENTKVCWDKVVHFLLKCGFWLPHAGQGCRKQGSGANMSWGFVPSVTSQRDSLQNCVSALASPSKKVRLSRRNKGRTFLICGKWRETRFSSSKFDVYFFAGFRITECIRSLISAVVSQDASPSTPTKKMFPHSPDPTNKPPPHCFAHKQPLLKLTVQINYCSRQKKVSKRVTRWCAKCGLHVIEKIKAPRLHSAVAVNAQGPPPHLTPPLSPPLPSPLLQTAFLW